MLLRQTLGGEKKAEQSREEPLERESLREAFGLERS